MKIGEHNEILEATLSELQALWKKNGWDQDYAFDKYVEIQTKHNGVKIKKSNGKNSVSIEQDMAELAKKEKEIAETKPELRKLKRLLS